MRGSDLTLQVSQLGDELLLSFNILHHALVRFVLIIFGMKPFVELPNLFNGRGELIMQWRSLNNAMYEHLDKLVEGGPLSSLRHRGTVHTVQLKAVISTNYPTEKSIDTRL